MTRRAEVRFAVRLAAVLLAVAIASVLRAGDESAVPPLAMPPGHGWAVVNAGAGAPASDNPAVARRRWALVHFPPRVGEGRSERGVIRVAYWLAAGPLAAASSDDRVYLAFGSEGGGAPRSLRQVLSMGAVRGLGTSWRNEPEGRFETLPSLPGEPELVALTGTSHGPVALLREESPGATGGGWRLLIAGGVAWEVLPLPWDDGAVLERGEGPMPPTAGDRCELLSLSAGPGLVVVPRGSAGAWVWTGRLLPPSRDGAVAPRVRWSGTKVRVGGIWPQGLSRSADTRRPSMLAVDDQIVGVDWTGERGMAIWLIREDEPLHLAAIPEAPAGSRIAPLPGSGSLAVIWAATGRDGSEAGPAGSGFEVREVSLSSGRVLFTGAGTQAGVISRRDLELLTLMVVIVMAAILLSVLRGNGRTLPALPAGMRPAEPGRRALGAAVDFAVGAAIAGWIYGVEPLVIAGVPMGRGPIQDIWPLLTALGVGMVHCTIGEWLFGRSIGKATVGCRVVRLVRPAAETTAGPAPAARPRLWQAVVRNLVRWGAPPVTVFAMSDPAGRHPGDLAAGTMVVVAGPAERPPERPEDGMPGGKR